MQTNFDLRKLDSLTKYPSILTYHKLGEKGRLVEELTFPNLPNNQDVYATEKVDGENGRIVLIIKDSVIDYLIGTRDELIYAMGDRIHNKHGNMVDTIIPFANTIIDTSKFISKYNNKLVVIFSESYGGQIAKSSKQYTSNKTQSIRMFDSFVMELSDVKKILEMDLPKIASWRDHNGQPYMNETDLKELSELTNISQTPRRDYLKSEYLPKTVEDTYNWLLKYSQSNVGLDKIDGLSEGVVVRNKDRSYIAKIRFEDYERTLKIQNKGSR